MYAQQTVAYAARDALIGETTNSTPESPPILTPPDIVKLCDLRREILRNLPTTCTHCKAEMLKEYIVDHKGSIIAYCKTPGACGRSLVLYAGVDFSYPIYEQTCRYVYTPPTAEATVGAAVSAPETAVISTGTEAVDAESFNTPDFVQQLQADAVQVPIQQYYSAAHFPLDQNGELDIYTLHGIPNPAHMCDTCGKGPGDHKKCDQNGWYEVRRGHYALPNNWPRYNSATKTWTNVE